MALTRTAVLLALLMVCAGCGEDPPPPKPVELPAPVVEAVPHEKRVLYALERLESGPAPLAGLRVKDIHRRNLELAEDDLLGLERLAQKHLAEPERIARVTGMARRNADPWHNVLRVLQGMEKHPAELILAWTRPVLDAPAGLVTLRLEAARVLATVREPEAAELMLALFQRDPASRELSTIAFSALLQHGGEARTQALDVALRRGSPELWADAWMRIGSLVPPGELDHAVADVLTWWSGLTLGSGPRLPTTLPHVKDYPWAVARLAVDEAVPGRADGKRADLVYGPIASTLTHGGGVYATDPTQEITFPTYAYLFTGKMPAGESRCVLARWEFAPYVAAVDADLLLQDIDDALYYAAKHCMLGPVTGDDADVRRELALELDRGAPWDNTRIRRVQLLMSSFTSCDDPATWSLHERVLFGMHPLDVCRPAVEQAYDAMRARPHDLTPLVVAGLEGQDPRRRGVAMHLVRRARDPVYLDALEGMLDRDPDRAEAGALKRTLSFIYTRGYGIEPDRYAPFIKRYESWLAASSDREFVALATGLLDFEELGEQAFARGLAGPQRDLFLAAWPRGRVVVPPEVAAAAIDPMGADTPRELVAGMLGRAYYSFPPEAAARLEALRRRLAPDVRPLVAPVLERVSHRAPFRRRVK